MAGVDRITEEILQEAKAGAQRKEFFTDPSMEAFMEMTGNRPEVLKGSTGSWRTSC